jgi:hypothetical protein
LRDAHAVRIVIGKIFADKNFRENNIGGTKMSLYTPQEGIFVPPILFPPIYFSLRSAKILNFTVIYFLVPSVVPL